MSSSIATFPFCVIEEGYARVVKRFGKVHRVLKPGINAVTPFVDRFVHVDWRFRNGAADSSRVYGCDLPTARLIFDTTNELST